MSKPAGFERLAILKPDHLGDLVLAIPAIRHLLKVYPESALFCASANEKLARFLFPEAEVKCVDFPVLAKSGNDLLPVDLSIFKIYDALVCLRNDGAYFTEKLAAWIDQPFFISAFDQTRHETDLQREVVEKLAGSYSRSQYFFGDRKLQFPESISRGGLAPAAGFSGNQWPLNYWIELGQALLRKNCEISLVGGPAEREILRILSHALEVPSSRVIVGISDFSGFLARVSELNLVIATDSGTAHLCSLVAPLLSIFGPSPFRRFAPVRSAPKGSDL